MPLDAMLGGRGRGGGRGKEGEKEGGKRREGMGEGGGKVMEGDEGGEGRGEEGDSKGKGEGEGAGETSDGSSHFFSLFSSFFFSLSAGSGVPSDSTGFTDFWDLQSGGEGSSGADSVPIFLRGKKEKKNIHLLVSPSPYLEPPIYLSHLTAISLFQIS